MPTIQIEVSPEVGEILARLARALLLSRREYVRMLLAEVARQAEKTSKSPSVIDKTPK